MLDLHTHTYRDFWFLLNNGKQTINRINFFVKTQWWLHPHPPNQKVQPAYMFLSKHVYEYIHTATVGKDIFISSAILSLCPPPQYSAALLPSGCVPLWPPTMSYLFLSQIRWWVSKNPLVPHQWHVPALSKVSGVAAFQQFLPVISRLFEPQVWSSSPGPWSNSHGPSTRPNRSSASHYSSSWWGC